MLFVSDFDKIHVLDILEKQICFMKILPVGVELYNVDRQTDMIKLTVVFRDFTKAYKEDSESERLDRQTDRQTDRQAGRQANGQIKRHIKYLKQGKLS
jgi:hypothetical protein